MSECRALRFVLFVAWLLLVVFFAFFRLLLAPGRRVGVTKIGWAFRAHRRQRVDSWTTYFGKSSIGVVRDGSVSKNFFDDAAPNRTTRERRAQLFQHFSPGQQERARDVPVSTSGTVHACQDRRFKRHNALNRLSEAA